jgi:hypothetical protein
MLPATKLRRLTDGPATARRRTTVFAPVAAQHPQAKKNRRDRPGIGVSPHYGGMAALFVSQGGWHKPARGQGHSGRAGMRQSTFPEVAGGREPGQPGCYGRKTTGAANSTTPPALTLEMWGAMADSLCTSHFCGSRSMRWMLASAAILYAVALCLLTAALVFGSSAARAGAAGPGPGLTANDTGGIIQWSPESEHFYKHIAVEHCARFNRYAGISSVRYRYGEYIGFRCVYDRRFDPRKMGWPPVY